MGVHTSKHQGHETESAQVLLLGIGNSGKSTLLKQLQIKYGEGFSEDEKKSYVQAINRNSFTSLQHSLFLLYNANSNAIALTFSINKDFIQRIISTQMPKCSFDELPFKLEINSLLEDPGFAKVAMSLYDPYSLKLLHRLSTGSFDLNVDDIMHCHLPTVCPNIVPFSVDGVNFKVIDVGGSMNERFEWKQHFESAHVIVWVVDVSEYNTPRLAEALRIFENTINVKDVINKPVVLIFSKYDLLCEKFANSDYQHVSFPDYEGPKKVENFIYFVWKKFKNADRHTGIPRLHHVNSIFGNHDIIPVLIKVVSENHPSVKFEDKYAIPKFGGESSTYISYEEKKEVKRKVEKEEKGSEETGDKEEQRKEENEEEEEVGMVVQKDTSSDEMEEVNMEESNEDEKEEEKEEGKAEDKSKRDEIQDEKSEKSSNGEESNGEKMQLLDIRFRDSSSSSTEGGSRDEERYEEKDEPKEGETVKDEGEVGEGDTAKEDENRERAKSEREKAEVNFEEAKDEQIKNDATGFEAENIEEPKIMVAKFEENDAEEAKIEENQADEAKIEKQRIKEPKVAQERSEEAKQSEARNETTTTTSTEHETDSYQEEKKDAWEIVDSDKESEHVSNIEASEEVKRETRSEETRDEDKGEEIRDEETRGEETRGEETRGEETRGEETRYEEMQGGKDKEVLEQKEGGKSKKGRKKNKNKRR